VEYPERFNRSGTVVIAAKPSSAMISITGNLSPRGATLLRAEPSPGLPVG
jgi:hypothetical protein